MITERKRKALERRFRRLLVDMAAAGVEDNDGNDVVIFFESGHALNVVDADGREKGGDQVLFDITTQDTGGIETPDIPGCRWIDCGAW